MAQSQQDRTYERDETGHSALETAGPQAHA
jgi:hypothetical protein